MSNPPVASDERARESLIDLRDHIARTLKAGAPTMSDQLRATLSDALAIKVGILMRQALATARAEALEAARACAAAWRDPPTMLLRVGEMTDQDLRTAQAVAAGIERAICALTPSSEAEHGTA